MTMRHKVFISYHHANDEGYKHHFETLFVDIYDVLVSRSVQDGDIDPKIATETIRQKIRDDFIADATVTVVLVGTETWKRKHVDWEISSSLRDTKKNPRCGLLGILLPSYPMDGDKYSRYTVPPRLWDNVESGYAKMYSWSKDPKLVQSWIHDAFLRKDKDPPPVNSRDMFEQNRSGDRWYP